MKNISQVDLRVYNHLLGKTEYIDDIPTKDDFLHAFVLGAEYAHAEILSIDVEAARQLPGVRCVLTAKDIPGINEMGAVFMDEPVLADRECRCVGQAVAIVAATTREIAKKAAGLIKVEYRELHAVTDVMEAYQKGDFVSKVIDFSKGDFEEEWKKSPYCKEGEFDLGGQEHFYLETQGAVCWYRENGIMKIQASTQNPSEVQHHAARTLGCDASNIEVTVGKLGGAFGGKETQGTWCAIWASLVCYHTHRNVKLVLSRDEDILMTGKRHPVKIHYKVGFDGDGRIHAYQVRYFFNCGHSADLSHSIIERCFLHSDNAYFIPAMEIHIYPCRTNLASNCAFRGFGGPQGIVAIERVMDVISLTLDKDPLAIRKMNYYGVKQHNHTHYGQLFKDNSLRRIHQDLVEQCDYRRRLKAVQEFNRHSRWVKRGISACPVKFGISFTTAFLNQGSALVNVYKDGSLIIHHGGIEMGQGLFDKILIVASKELGVPVEKIRVYPTNTAVVPNTSATAASTGSDLNGQAVILAIDALKKRLEKVAEDLEDKSFENIVKQAYVRQISLSEKAYYRTPGIYLDRKTMTGHPFFYYVCGMAVSEVEVDLLTGDIKVLRADIIHDSGHSIDEVIDRGQVEGAYVQSVGWLTSEEWRWNGQGRPVSNADTYKIPGIYDLPRILNVELYQDNPFKFGTFHSRAIGEPPFIYGISVPSAVFQALKDVKPQCLGMNLPLTKENITLL